MKKCVWLAVLTFLFLSACASSGTVDTGEVAINLDKLAVQEVIPLPGLEGVSFLKMQNLALSPDGTKFARVDGRYLTVYAIDGTQLTVCDNPAGIDSRGFVWSPDSKKIAFTEDFWRFMKNSDLHVLDVASGSVNNLTYDGVKADVLKAPEGTPFDTDPEWLGNDTIIFFRVKRMDGIVHYTLQSIPAAGGSPTELYDMTEFNGAKDYPAFFVTHKKDKLIFQQGLGVWLLDLQSKSASRLADIEQGWVVTGISQDDSHLMLVKMGQNLLDLQFMILPVNDPTNPLKLEAGDKAYFTAAGWLPTGSAFAYIRHSIVIDEQTDYELYVVNSPGETARLIYGGDFAMVSLSTFPTLNWARNNQFVLLDADQNKSVLVKLTDK
jgi:Tol biopolymer transport system component